MKEEGQYLLTLLEDLEFPPSTLPGPTTALTSAPWVGVEVGDEVR